MLSCICILFRGGATVKYAVIYRRTPQFFIIAYFISFFLSLCLLCSGDGHWLKGAFWLSELAGELHIQQLLNDFNMLILIYCTPARGKTLP